MIYFSKKKGLKIVFVGSKIYKNEFDQYNRKPGRYVKFENGRFFTEDTEVIAELDRWMIKHPNELTKVDEKYQELEHKYLEEAKQKATAEYEKAKERARKEMEGAIRGKGEGK